MRRAVAIAQAPAAAAIGDGTAEPLTLGSRARLPVIFPERAFVDAGGLLSYGIDVPVLWQRTDNDVGPIHRGAKPDELPIGQPACLAPVVNLRTARMPGIALPHGVPARAEEAIG